MALNSSGSLSLGVQNQILAERGLDPNHFVGIPASLQEGICRGSTYKVPMAVLQRQPAPSELQSTSHSPANDPLDSGFLPSSLGLPAGPLGTASGSDSKTKLCVVARTYSGYGISQMCAFSLGLILSDPTVRIFSVYNGGRAEAEEANQKMLQHCRAAFPHYRALDVTVVHDALPPFGVNDYGYFITNMAVNELLKLGSTNKSDECDYILVRLSAHVCYMQSKILATIYFFNFFSKFFLDSDLPPFNLFPLFCKHIRIHRRPIARLLIWTTTIFRATPELSNPLCWKALDL